jgi:hypothetical protein
MYRCSAGLFAVPLLALAAQAQEPASISCYFQTGEHFTVVGQGSVSMIQWNDGPFHDAAASFVDPLLMITQTAQGNLFRMVFNVRNKEAYGETQWADGHSSGGPLWCVFK